MCGKVAKLDPGRATGTSLDRTDANGERPPQRCTTSQQWHRGVFTNPTGVPRNLRKLSGKPMTGHRKKYTSKFPIKRHGETPSCSECLGAQSQHASRRREKLNRVAQPETVQHVHQAVGTKRGAEDHPMSSSAKRAHAIPSLVFLILLQSDVEVGPASVQRDAKRTSSMCEEPADQPGMEACLDTAGECCDCDAGEVLGWNAKVDGIRSEPTQLQESEMFKRRRKYEKPTIETVNSTKTSHKAKRDEVQSRVVK